MKAITEKTNPLKLAWPIFIETLLFMIMGNIDTLMLSRFSDNAVAAVGNANQILTTFLIFFTVTSAATGIMVAQYLGAENRKALNQIYNLAFGTNLMMSLVIALSLFCFKTQFLALAKVPESLRTDTMAYLNVSVYFMFVPALFVVASTIMKTHGQTRTTMKLAVGMNVLNVIGNYVFLFGPFGLPVLGVKGVAISTIFSRSIALVILFVLLIKQFKMALGLKYLRPFPKAVFKQFIKIGLPSAGEPMSWQFSQMVILVFINTMGNTAITTKIYVQIIVWFSYLGCLAIAQANQIVVGHLIGAGKEEDAARITLKSLKQSLGITIIMSILIAIMGPHIIGLFTSNPTIIQIGSTILWLDVLVEIGRVFNLVLIFAVKAAGDVNYPVTIGILSMWLVSTLFAYVLGIHFAWGLIGVWVAMAADELLRGALMYRRLKSGKWRGKRITTNI